MTTTADLIANPTEFSSETVKDLYQKLDSKVANLPPEVGTPAKNEMRNLLKAIINVSNIDDDVDDAAAGI